MLVRIPGADPTSENRDSSRIDVWSCLRRLNPYTVAKLVRLVDTFRVAGAMVVELHVERGRGVML